MVTTPSTSDTAPTAEQAAMERARMEFNGQGGIVFRPDARGGQVPAVVDLANQKPSSSAMSVLLSPQLRGTVQEQAAAAAAPAVNAGTADNAPSSGDSGASAGLAGAIEVLSALTGESPENVRKGILNDKGLPDLSNVREFMNTHRSAIEQAIKPENLQKLPQAQRDALRTFLGTMGYPVNAQAFGTTPEQQAQALSRGTQDAAQDLGMGPEDMFSMLILGLLAEAFGLQGAFSGVLGMMGGGNTHGMRTGSGGMGTARSGGMGAASSGPAKFSNEPQLERIVQGVQGKGTIAGVVNLANALDGQHEVGKNGGAIVRATMGYTGDAWCGGFVRYVFDKSGLNGVYDQSDYVSAQSYMREGKRNGAFRSARSGYQPQAGDVLVFSSSRGAGSGHVGVVVARNGDQVTYVSGNDTDAVRTRTISLSNPPGNLFGYSDTEAVAKAKGKLIQRAPEQVANPNARGTTEALGRTG